jgi:hypothetical protein
MHIPALYHLAVRLQHEGGPKRRLAIALEPPGNCSRELSLYRRRIFRELGEASALALPDLAFLAWCLPAGKGPASPRSPGRLRLELDSCWSGVDGSFATSGLASRSGSVFLSLEGSISMIVEHAARAAASLGLDVDPVPAIEPGRGFFLFRGADRLASLDPSALPPPPELSFLDCSIALLRFDLGAEPLAVASWRTLARSRRRTGP